MRASKKLPLAFLLMVAVSGLLFLPKTTSAEDQLAFPEKDTKELLHTLIKIMTEEWIASAASGRATEEEMVVPLILRKAIRIDALKYLMIDAPIDTALKITTNSIKIARLVYGLDASTVLREIEKITVKMAIQKGMTFLLQNEIRLTPGALDIEYISKKGNLQKAIFQYIIVFKPLTNKQGGIGLEIYSPKPLEPPKSQGWATMGTPNVLQKNLPPFVVKIQGRVEKKTGYYSWLGTPKIDILFPKNVPDLGFKPLSFWQRHMWKPLEEKIKEVKVVLRKISGGPVKVAGSAKSLGSKVGAGIKKATLSTVGRIKSYFRGGKLKTEAQITSSNIISPTTDITKLPGQPKEILTKTEGSPLQIDEGQPFVESVEVSVREDKKAKEVGKTEEKIGSLDDMVEQLDEIAEQIELLTVRTEKLIARKMAAENAAQKAVKGASIKLASDEIGEMPGSDFLAKKTPEIEVASPEDSEVNAEDSPTEAVDEETETETTETPDQGTAEHPTYRPTVYVPPPPPPKILLSELQIESEKGASDEFIELYNPNPSNVALGEWSLQRATKTGTISKKNFAAGDVILSQEYFLVANKYASQAMLSLADMAHNSFGITADNTIFLVASRAEITSGREATIIDKVGYGEPFFSETMPAPAPEEGQTVGRKWATTTQAYQDMDNNFEDFEAQLPTPKAQNQAIPEPEPEPEEEPPATSTPKILISEIQIEGDEKSHDFIELFNPGTRTVNISGFQLKKRTSSGKEYSVRVLPEGSVMAGEGYFLWANAAYASTTGAILADATSTQSLAATNSVAFLDEARNIIDQVAWRGGTNPFVETVVFPETPKTRDPIGDWLDGLGFSGSRKPFPSTLYKQSLGRKTDEQGGEQDTDNNAEDFELQNPTPKAKNETFIEPILEDILKTLDAIPPEAEITSNPPVLTNQTQATFVFSANEEGSTFQCKIDESDWRTCTSPTDYRELTEGSHRFQVKATDLVGNPSEIVEYDWTVDTSIESPSLFLADFDSTSTSTAYTNNQTVKIEIAQDQEALYWFLSESPEKPATNSPGWLLTEPFTFILSDQDGAKTVYIWTKDQAENVSELGNSASIVLDTTEPQVEITEAPSNPTNQATTTFVFSCNEENCSFSCKIDEEDWQNCSSSVTYTTLAEGSHRFQVKAMDRAGNHTSTSSDYNWLLDITPPSSQVEGLATSSTSTFLTINWSGTDNASGTLNYDVQYKDLPPHQSSGDGGGTGGEWQTLAEATTSQQTGFTGEDGHTYYFQSRARDIAGNEELWPAEPDTFTKIEVPKDETPPSSIADLTAETDETPGEIILAWTAPEDRGHLGQTIKAVEYIIKYFSEEIIEENWASSTKVAAPPAPQEASTTQSFIVSGLANNTTYHFAIKSKDEAGNISLISNSTSSETLAAILEVSTTTLNFSAVQDGENPAVQFLIIQNTGGIEMAWAISTSSSWVLPATTTGILPANSSTSIEIAVDVAGLGADSYQSTTTIEATDAKNSPQDVQINLVVEEPPNQAPNAAFSYQPIAPFVNEEIVFNASQSNDADGAVLEYIWDFDDGSATSTQSPIVSHSFSSSDQFLVMLYVEDNDQATSSLVSANIEVAQRPYWQLVISEVQTEDRYDKKHDFIELFNPTTEDIDISGFQLKLKKRTSSGGEYSVRVLPAGSIIPSGGYFLWTNTAYASIGGISADATSTQSLAANNSVAFLDEARDTIDQVAWGDGTGQFVETAAFSENPSEDQSLTRKKDENGDYIDIDDNSQDFEIANPTPTNSQGQTGNMLAPEPVKNLQAEVDRIPDAVTLGWASSTDADTANENISYTVYYWDQAELTEETAATTTAGITSTTTATTTLVLEGFSYNSSYYFGVRAFDGLYYSDVATTTLHTPLSTITDLTAAPSATRQSIDLVWTANGASKYLIKYASDRIPDAVTWENATTVENSISPKTADNSEIFTVEGLAASTTYHFAVKTVAANNATSVVSNSASSTAIAGFQDNGDGTITDLYTNLMYQAYSVPDAATWQAAKTYCNNLVLCNDGAFATSTDCTENGGVKYDDWRMPNFKEMTALVNYNTTSPAAYSQFFGNIAPSTYWSSSHIYTPPESYPTRPERYAVRFISFNDGLVGITLDTDESYYTLAVRGQSQNLQVTGLDEPQIGCNAGFQDNGANTKTDLCTGLMWTNTLTGIGYTDEFGEYGVNWRRATQVAREERFGYSDWRVPNVRELLAVSGVLWSAEEEFWALTPYFSDINKKWFVNFRTTKGAASAAPENQSYYIKLARDGE